MISPPQHWRALRLAFVAALALGTSFSGILPAAAPATLPPAAQVEWDGVQRVVAFGDVHGAYEELHQLLVRAQVISADDHWAAGTSHVVSLGDLIDRGSGSRQVMDLLMRLQDEARTAGGQMHVLLGNHEVMGLLGDLRYVIAAEYASFADLESPASREAARSAWRNGTCAAPCAEFDQRFPPGYFGHRAAFAPEGRYGRWLLSLPVAIRINDSLFMHAGPASAVQGMDLSQLNLRYRGLLAQYIDLAGQLSQAGLLTLDDAYELRARLARQRLAATPGGRPAPAIGDAVRRFEAVAADPLLSEDGPNWYRGFALCREVTEADLLASELQQFHAARLVVGHTPTRNARVVSRFEGRVIKVDTGMNRAAYRGTGSALLVQPGELGVQYADRQQTEPVLPEGLFVAPSQLQDGEVLEALSGSEMSVTGPRGPDEMNVAVTRNGRTVPAVFRSGGKDSVQRELAAYRLDRLLGLGIVPATAERELDGRQGFVQARPRRWTTQAEMKPGTIESSWCRAEPQFQLMYVLDTLTGNENRTPQSILYDVEDGTVLTTAFARAFGQGKGLPAWLRTRPPSPGAELRRRLALLDAASLQKAVGELLDGRARQAILSRRDALLALPAQTQALDRAKP